MRDTRAAFGKPQPARDTAPRRYSAPYDRLAAQLRRHLAEDLLVVAGCRPLRLVVVVDEPAAPRRAARTRKSQRRRADRAGGCAAGGAWRMQLSIELSLVGNRPGREFSGSSAKRGVPHLQRLGELVRPDVLIELVHPGLEPDNSIGMCARARVRLHVRAPLSVVVQRVCARARARVCVSVCVCVCARVRVHVRAPLSVVVQRADQRCDRRDDRRVDRRVDDLPAHAPYSPTLPYRAFPHRTAYR